MKPYQAGISGNDPGTFPVVVQHTELRVQLWTLRAALVFKAQSCDLEAEALELKLQQVRDQATRYRYDAQVVEQAANTFGVIDKSGND